MSRRRCRSSWLAGASGEAARPQDLFERRCLHFAGEVGHEEFQRRLRTPAFKSLPRPVIACDREIDGPWSQYATVWRFAVQPVSDGFLRAGSDYFFW